MAGCHYQVEQGVITRWDVACGGVLLPGRTSLVVGCCYQVEQGVITRWDVACGGVLLPGGTSLVVGCCYQVGRRLWWGVVTR